MFRRVLFSGFFLTSSRPPFLFSQTPPFSAPPSKLVFSGLKTHQSARASFLRDLRRTFTISPLVETPPLFGSLFARFLNPILPGRKYEFFLRRSFPNLPLLVPPLPPGRSPVPGFYPILFTRPVPGAALFSSALYPLPPTLPSGACNPFFPPFQRRTLGIPPPFECAFCHAPPSHS